MVATGTPSPPYTPPLGLYFHPQSASSKPASSQRPGVQQKGLGFASVMTLESPPFPSSPITMSQVPQNIHDQKDVKNMFKQSSKFLFNIIIHLPRNSPSNPKHSQRSPQNLHFLTKNVRFSTNKCQYYG